MPFLEGKRGTVTRFLRGLNVRYLALLIQFLASLSFYLMNNFIPLFINTELHYSLIDATSLAGLYSLVGAGVAAAAAPFLGFLYDRFGMKKVWMLVLIENIAAYAGFATSTSGLEILILRGLQGFCAMSTIVFAFTASVATGEELKKSLSYQLAAMTLGQLTGPGIGGLLVSAVGYRWTFVTAALFYVAMVPLVLMLQTPGTKPEEAKTPHSEKTDLKTLLPDALALILVYMCMYFLTPIVPWFIESIGVPYDQLIISTAIVTMLDGLAFAMATSLLTRIVKGKVLPILPILAAGVILTTAFSQSFLQFILLQIALFAILSGVPPNLFGGRTERRGIAMGLLNSARFIGQAIGPFLATSILGNGEVPRPFDVFAVMTSIALLASFAVYTANSRKKTSSPQFRKEQQP